MSNALYTRTQGTKELSQLIAIYLAFPPHCLMAFSFTLFSQRIVTLVTEGMESSKDGSS